MRKQKLKLDELKVQSFVTHFDKEQNQTQEMNGGAAHLFLLSVKCTTGITHSLAGGCPTTF
jgi:hypothetical protein